MWKGLYILSYNFSILSGFWWVLKTAFKKTVFEGSSTKKKAIKGNFLKGKYL